MAVPPSASPHLGLGARAHRAPIHGTPLTPKVSCLGKVICIFANKIRKYVLRCGLPHTTLGDCTGTLTSDYN